MNLPRQLCEGSRAHLSESSNNSVPNPPTSCSAKTVQIAVQAQYDTFLPYLFVRKAVVPTGQTTT